MANISAVNLFQLENRDARGRVQPWPRSAAFQRAINPWAFAVLVAGSLQFIGPSWFLPFSGVIWSGIAFYVIGAAATDRQARQERAEDFDRYLSLFTDEELTTAEKNVDLMYEFDFALAVSRHLRMRRSAQASRNTEP